MSSDQFHHRRSESFGYLLWQIVAGARNHAMRDAFCKFRDTRLAVSRRHHAVAITVERDRGHRDRRQRRKLALDLRVLRVALGKAETMPVTVDHDVDVVRIVMGGRAARETGIVEI